MGYCEEATAAIVQARKHIEDYDPHLAVYVLLELQATEEAGLRQDAWRLDTYGATVKQATALVDALDEYVKSVMMKDK